jgi:hypothetical protein
MFQCRLSPNGAASQSPGLACFFANPGLWDATPSALNPALKLELPGCSRSILAKTKEKLPTVSSVSRSQRGAGGIRKPPEWGQVNIEAASRRDE